uniref:tRNA (adenine(58)-N(1))-methyltransferase n=1 Tax=Amblyomma maculatum TaxID=34609 RepID=G3MTM6_AMBMU
MTNFLSHDNVAKVGDTCIVYCTFAHIYSIKLARGDVFQTKYGALKHDDVMGCTYGTKVQCSRGYVYVLRATPELWTLTLPHRTQILYTRDISLVTLQLDLKPGSVVCEVGTGSGSMTHALARTVAPNGHVYTFDFHEHRAQVAKKEFQEHGLESVVTASHRDVCQDGFGIEGLADAVFLDLPHPWEAVEAAATALKPVSGGRICSFSPCVEQVQRTCLALRARGFVDVVTWECLERPYEVKQITMGDIRDTVKPPTAGLSGAKEERPQLRSRWLLKLNRWPTVKRSHPNQRMPPKSQRMLKMNPSQLGGSMVPRSGGASQMVVIQRLLRGVFLSRQPYRLYKYQVTRDI